MTILPIVKHPSPILAQVSADVTQWNRELDQLVQNMFDTMKFAKGVGLAAIQVGIPLCLFVTDVGKGKERRPLVFINPKITQRSGEIDSVEGCLSYPGFEGTVKRSAKVTVEAFDLQRRKFKVKGEELFGRVIQHEYDHLEGIMYLDKVVGDTLHPMGQSSEM